MGYVYIYNSKCLKVHETLPLPFLSESQNCLIAVTRLILVVQECLHIEFLLNTN